MAGMDKTNTHETGRMGGLKRVSNLTSEQLSRQNKKYARAGWRGHVKGAKACPCRRCIKKNKNAKSKA